VTSAEGPLLEFAKGFPDDPELGRLLGAFEAGDYRTVRDDAPKLAERTKDPRVRAAALDLRRPGEAQAIVILGGGIRRDAAEFGGDTLARLTLERVRYGALVARTTRLPVLVSGGSVFGGTAEAALMKRALEQEFNVEVRWSEERSRDTRSNAAESASMLLPLGIKRILLVTHGFDVPRAGAEFATAGFQVTPAPTFVAAERFGFYPEELLPSMSALQASYYAIYELLAEALRRLRQTLG